MKAHDVENLPTEGNRGFEALCKLVRDIGHKDPCSQLMNKNGSCVGDLMCFLEDNPGAINTLYTWIVENYFCEDCGRYIEDHECGNSDECGEHVNDCMCEEEDFCCGCFYADCECNG